MPDVATTLATLAPLLQRTDSRPVAVMMCGMAGSGKSTLSHAITARYPHFTRLSIDGINHARNGLYGIDYDRSLYAQYQDEAAEIFEERLKTLLAEGRDVVLDRAFYARADREVFRRMIEEGGNRCVLVCFRAEDREVLWRRVQERSERRGELVGERRGDAAFEITREMFDDVYWEGFEWPEGEGEVVVLVE